MKRIVGAIAVLALTASCSSETSGESRPAAVSTPASTSTTASTAVSAETIKACRKLAEDKDLKAFWQWVANNKPPYPPDERQLNALSAVARLSRTASGPQVDALVASTMKKASSQAEVMKDQWVKSGTLDVDQFRGLITPIVEACQAQDVNMSVPE